MVSMQVLEERWFMAERRRQERRQRNRERSQRRQLNTEHLTARTHLPLPPSPHTHTHSHTHTHTFTHTAPHHTTPHHTTPHHTTPHHLHPTPTPPPAVLFPCIPFSVWPFVERQRLPRAVAMEAPPRGGGGSDGCVRCFGTKELAAAFHHSRDVVPAQHVGQRAQKTANSAGARPGVLKNPSRREGLSRSVTWLPQSRSSWCRRWLGVTLSASWPVWIRRTVMRYTLS